MTLTDRLESGERWDGDNAEVLRACGWALVSEEWEEGVDYHWRRPDGSETHTDLILPLESVDAALALVPEGWIVSEMQRHPMGGWAWRLERTTERARADGFSLYTMQQALVCAILRAQEAGRG